MSIKVGGGSPKQRIVWIDYARATAILMVILCHSTENVYEITLDGMHSVSALSEAFAFTLFTIGRLGVPIFLFISGYLMLDRQYDGKMCFEFWKTKWLGLLFATEIWIVVYWLFSSFVCGNDLEFITLIKDMLFLQKSKMGHMWFMPMILGLYLFLPFIANGLKWLNDARVLVFPLCVAFAIFLVVPVASTIAQCFGGAVFESQIAQGFSGGAYGCYMLLGYCVKKRLFSRLRIPALAFIGFLAFILVVWLQCFAFGQMVPVPAWYTNGLLFLAGLAVFLLFSRLKNLHPRRIVSVVSRYSFALYLVHYPVLLLLYPVIGASGIPTHLLRIAVLFCVVFATSLVICIVIARIPKIGSRMLYMR